MSEQRLDVMGVSGLSSKTISKQSITNNKIYSMQAVSSSKIPGNCITGYDMVAAITQDTINLQLLLLWDLLDEECRKMKWEYTLKHGRFTLNYSFEGEMDAPEVILGTSKAPNFQVKLALNIPEGTLTYGVGEDKDSVTISDWKYVFDVDVNFAQIEQDHIQNSIAVPDVVKNMLHKFNDECFTIRHLLMDFQNANIANYDEVESKITLSEDFTEDDLISFQTGLTKYFRDLAETENPFVLGYSIEEKTPDSDPSIPPTFTPTGGTYWIFFEEDESKRSQSTLNFLLTTDTVKKPLPYPTKPNFNNNWVSSNEYDGRFVLAKSLFFGEFILPKLQEALGHYITGERKGDDSILIKKSGLEWTLTESPEKGSSRWKYTYDKTFNWNAKDVEVWAVFKNVPIEVDHWITNKFWFTVELGESTSSNTLPIKLNGEFYIHHEFLCHPLGFTNERMSLSAKVGWEGTIDVTCGTQGVVELKPSISFKETDINHDGNFWGDLDQALLERNVKGLENNANWIKSQYEKEVNDLLNLFAPLGNRFVLPAGGVFAFKNPEFDDFQNLLFDITYKTEGLPSDTDNEVVSKKDQITSPIDERGSKSLPIKTLPIKTLPIKTLPIKILPIEIIEKAEEL